MPARSRSPRHIDYWPGFVDALSTMLLVIVFLLSVFMLGQFFVSREIVGKDDRLDTLNRQIAELTEILSLERQSGKSLQNELSLLNATLALERGEAEKLKSAAAGAGAADQRVNALSNQLDSEKQNALRALAQVDILAQQISALRRQLQSLEAALDVAEKREKDSQARLTDLGSRLNVALAQRVQELTRYRSDFFGRLSQILGNRPEIRVVGDRFVFQSEVLFPSGAADLTAGGREEMDKLANAIRDLEREIPPDIPWVLRVDGHTDKRPLSGAGQYKDNWELSASRAIAVVRYFVQKGISPQRLVAAGFGEFAPIDQGETPDAFNRNRRLEFKLTER